MAFLGLSFRRFFQPFVHFFNLTFVVLFNETFFLREILCTVDVTAI